MIQQNAETNNILMVHEERTADKWRRNTQHQEGHNHKGEEASNED